MAVADSSQKYREYADTIRKEVWGMDLPSFKSPLQPRSMAMNQL